MTNIINKNRLLVGLSPRVPILGGAVIACLAALLFSCRSKERLDPEIEKLGRATGPVEPGATAFPNQPMARQASAKVHRGKVLEAMDASRYTYLRIDTGKEEVWAAVPKSEVAVGQSVEVAESIVMKDFSSPTLARKFDVIVFGTMGGSSVDGGTPATR